MANMLFMHTWRWITGKSPHTGKPKLATSRIVKPGQRLVDTFYDWQFQHVYDQNDRIVYATPSPLNIASGRYAVMPARGVKGIRKVADITLTGITRYDVREITDEQVAAEGFGSTSDGADGRWNFLQTWVKMHDPKFVFWYEPRIVGYMWYTSTRQMNQGLSEIGGWEHLQAAINSRPSALYSAWYLEYTITEVYPAAVAIAEELLK